MEMCYDGALVMPSNYAVMDEDEMMYVEGGNGWYNSVTFIGSCINAALYLAPALAAINSACKAGKAVSTVCRALNIAKSTIIAGVEALLKKIGASATSTAIAKAIVGTIWTFSGLSIGFLVAKGIDIVDGKTNGYCFG